MPSNRSQYKNALCGKSAPKAETRVTAATTAALRQNHSRRQSAPGRSTVN
jgi:hypothetical protein